MSENKYIIDKDSLTGIADAVRDKLGNGEAITDEDAGYYPVPIKKLGYYEAIDSASYSGPGTGYTSVTIYARPVSELENICGMRPSYIKVTVKPSAAFNSNDIIFRCTNPNQPSSTIVSSARFDAKYTAILSIPSDVEDCYVNYGGYYSSYSSQYTTRNIPAYDAVFLDSNQNEINISEYSGDSFTVNQWGTTKPFLTGTSFEKIPFSIEDIQDKITNYLGKKSMVKTKLFLKRKSSSTTETDYGEYSNYFWTTSAYNYNVGTSDPSYITTKAPDLRPENIIYMSVISSNNNEHFYEFRPQLYAMQHYKTLTQSGSGKRLTTATDYYFFPNGSKLKSYSENYGILAHWDSNNLILDLQSVQKSSGTIDGTISASSSAYIIPYSLYIIYKEATE